MNDANSGQLTIAITGLSTPLTAKEREAAFDLIEFAAYQILDGEMVGGNDLETLKIRWTFRIP